VGLDTMVPQHCLHESVAHNLKSPVDAQCERISQGSCKHIAGLTSLAMDSISSSKASSDPPSPAAATMASAAARLSLVLPLLLAFGLAGAAALSGVAVPPLRQPLTLGVPERLSSPSPCSGDRSFTAGRAPASAAECAELLAEPAAEAAPRGQATWPLSSRMVGRRSPRLQGQQTRPTLRCRQAHKGGH
jgi:hypothetical protein